MNVSANEKSIRDYYEAFNAKRFSAMLELLANDVIHDANQGTRSVDKAAFKDFLAAMDKFYDERLEDIQVMTSPSSPRAAAEFLCKGALRSPWTASHRYAVSAIPCQSVVFLKSNPGKLRALPTITTMAQPSSIKLLILFTDKHHVKRPGKLFPLTRYLA